MRKLGKQVESWLRTYRQWWVYQQDSWQARRFIPAETIRSHWISPKLEQSPQANTLCLVAHYDPDGWVDPTVLYLLNALHHQLQADVVLISTSPHLREDHQAHLRTLCQQTILRHNRGIDFGSWAAALSVIPHWQQYQRVAFINDSVYGPFFPLTEAFNAMAAVPVWGMTDNWAIAWHLQSYFLVVQQPVLSSELFKAFWLAIRPYNDKSRMIRTFEVGFTQRLVQAGLTPQAYAPYRQLRRKVIDHDDNHPMREAMSNNRFLSPTHTFWEAGIDHVRLPFIKRSLLQLNPTQMPSVYRWDEVLAAAGSDYPAHLIERHVKRTGSRLAP